MILLGKDFENPMGISIKKTGRIKMLSEVIDSTIMPGIQGGPLMHVIAAKAVAFGEVQQPEFVHYAEQIIKNAKALGEALLSKDYQLVSGGTDNHLVLIDLRNKDITGKAAEEALEKAGITVNKNMVPFDDKSPFVTSGIRVGTPALTTRGMKEDEMRIIASFIDDVITQPDDDAVSQKTLGDIFELCQKFPLYDL